MTRTVVVAASFLLLGLVAPRPAASQEMAGARDEAAQVVIPQLASARAPGVREPVRVESVAVAVSTLGPAATTTLEVTVRNPGAALAEAVLLVPVPEGASVRRFDFHGTAAEPTARLLQRDEARRTYESIVRRTRDPALLEFAGDALLRSSVFPVPPRGTQKVVIAYDHVLAADGSRIDYVLPRSEASAEVPWTFTAEIRSRTGLATAYSPSHAVRSERVAHGHLRVTLADGAASQPGPFRLSWLAEGTDLPASLYACPDGRGGGWFLFLAAPADRMPADGASAAPREVTIVLDRSGSMAGGKLDQARAAALQTLEGLGDADTFRIVDFSDAVARFSDGPARRDAATLTRAREYLAALRPSGGTNLHGALVEALTAPAATGVLPLVLFLTDGCPTVGRTLESEIGSVAAAENPGRRRVFTFGVGVDVNAPLLDRIANVTGGAPSYVLPGQDVEATVGRVARRLCAPVLADVTLRADAGAGGTAATVLDLLPARLPDLFAGDQLVVLGRYRGTGRLHLVVEGARGVDRRAASWDFDLNRSTQRNAFVPRLWASRRIGELADALRQAGADPAIARDPSALRRDPLHRERIDEIVALSREFGVLSEYTAFLATEGTDLSDATALAGEAGRSFFDRALGTRSGAGAANQSLNNEFQRRQSVLNGNNFYIDESLREARIDGVVQVADRAFFRRGGGWVDGNVLANGRTPVADVTLTFGSDEHLALVRELVTDNRQAVAALGGAVVIEHRGRVVRILAAGAEAPAVSRDAR